jgi:hypothetical protein
LALTVRDQVDVAGLRLPAARLSVKKEKSEKRCGFTAAFFAQTLPAGRVKEKGVGAANAYSPLPIDD